MLKISIHSVTDLITNSSTVIFTYSEGSVSAVRDMVNEMCKVFGSNHTFDSLFYSEVFLDDDWEYINYLKENQDSCSIVVTGPDFIKNYLTNLKSNILKGIEKKPAWMVGLEESEDSYDYYRRPTSLYLEAKDEVYKELSDKIIKFLYSTSNETSNG